MRINTYKKLLRDRRILFLTGAGISTASGIPDYISDEDYQGPSVFDVFRSMWNQEVSHSLLRHNIPVFRALTTAKRSTAHLTISNFLRANRRSQLITQNVDGLHGMSRQVYEAHGSLLRAKSLVTRRIYRIARRDLRRLGTALRDDMSSTEVLHRIWRTYKRGIPDVVFMQQRIHVPACFMTTAADTFDLLFCVGTSGRIGWVQSLASEFLSRGKHVLSCAEYTELPFGVTDLSGDIQRVIPRLLDAT